MTTTNMTLAGTFTKDQAGYQGSDGLVYPYTFSGDTFRYVIVCKAGRAGDKRPCMIDGTRRIDSLRGSTGDAVHVSDTQSTGLVVNNRLKGGIGYLVKDKVFHKYDNFITGTTTNEKIIYVISTVNVGNVVYKLANGGTYADGPAEVWDLADKTVEAKTSSDLLVITADAAAQTTTTGVCVDTEVAYDMSATTNVGDVLYLGTVGTITPDVPISGEWSRRIGTANETTIQVNIDPSWGEIA